jgi:pyruvate-formate lyase-activating enzyme
MIDHKELYRLPWTLPDNAISWLEPTSLCNLSCDGCYRMNEKDSHKSLTAIRHELDIFQRMRTSDCISIAGGDPLLHPEIVEIVREVKARGLKPIVNTNGKALTMDLLKELKSAGVFGFTFHVDSKQGRAGKWKGKSEPELNELRLEYARMLADIGGISCSFNSTVYEDTLQHVPELVAWAQEHIDIVHTMVFIAFRHVVPDLPFEWYAGGRKIEWDEIGYHSDHPRRIDIRSTDILDTVRGRFADFTPAAYLNGTEEPDSFKWMLTVRLGSKDRIYGYLGPKFVELVMSAYHFATGRYLSYASPRDNRRGRTVLLLWPFDRGTRRALGRYFRSLLANPFRIFKRVHSQSIMFIQPIDFLPYGGQSMCDGCPDITVWNDRLVWSCRMEEPKKFGTFLTTVPGAGGTDIDSIER